MKELLFCIFIFLGKTLDVSMGSIRVIFLVKGRSLLASFFAFVEILLWFIIIRTILINKINIIELLSYALGYSFGTYIGILINKKFEQKK